MLQFHSIRILFLFLGTAFTGFSQVIRQDLSGADWRFKELGNSNWRPASVPGTVHTDLMAVKALGDPFHRDNEKWVQWVSNLNWEYEKVWTPDPAYLTKSRLELVFDGLDTYAEVYLNGQILGKTENMFCQYRFRVEKVLKPGQNQLRVVFRSPLVAALPDLVKNPLTLPAINDAMPLKTSPYTRKAGYHFGWDWGPRLVTSGIWRSVRLEGSDLLRFGSPFLYTESLKPGEARLKGQLRLSQMPEADVRIEWVFGSKSEFLPARDTLVALSKILKNPNLWSPSRPHLYPVVFRLWKGRRVLDSISFRFGVRMVELIHEKDAFGKSFYFKVNGIPTFMKGANYIPQDNFLTRVSPERHRRLLVDAARANMNMLRVWGGGIYEDDRFYELCDSLGILIWQDFMFACTMYPGTTSFQNQVREEVRQNVRRLRNHACLALWCGNNENETGWKKKWMMGGIPYSSPDSARIYEDHKALFHKIIPEIVQQEDPSRFYTRSSPTANDDGIAPDKPGYGDIHDWFVWFGTGDYRAYRRTVSRFQSEYGYQSFPAMESIRLFSSEKDWSEDSDVMDVHQKHPNGNAKIKRFMEPFYGTPRNFEEFLYFSQLQQAEAMAFAIRSHRSRAPYCMGSLYWQLNDCWPAASWSSIDYYGRWKATHFFARKAYAPWGFQLVPAMDSVRLSVFGEGSSERGGTRPAQVRVEIRDFSGSEKFRQTQQVPVTSFSEPGSTSWKMAVSLPAGLDSSSCYIRAVLLGAKGEELATETGYFALPRYLKLPQPVLEKKLVREGTNWFLELRSPVLVKNLLLASEKGDWQYSDNYFDLLPGQVLRVGLEGRGTPALADFQFRTLSGRIP